VKKKVEVKSHVLLLKHEKLDKKSSENLLKKYNIEAIQLPFILKKDPALRQLKDINAGDVIKVVRNSPTANKSKFYRVVVDG
tara:strand:+ start:220 stop:465 length:246 start_codon:yes stop_codon:yes gene_type:complete